MAASACQPVGQGTGAIASPSPEPVTSTAPRPTPTPTPTPTATPTSSPRPPSAINENVCGSGPGVAGIDVSDYNSGTVWSTVQGDGKSFSFVKATEGAGFKNVYFASDWAKLKSVGMIRGAYHYFHPSADPVQQANLFLSTIGTLESRDLPPVLDWEETDGVALSVVIQNALVWLAQVETATRKLPVIYVSPSFYNHLGNPAQFSKYPLFIANYEVSCPALPPPWNNWTFWQQGSGPVSGVQATAVDLDLFNGSLGQLQAFASSGAAALP